jgi:hypothetical protein
MYTEFRIFPNGKALSSATSAFPRCNVRINRHHSGAEFAWFDRLTMSDRKPLTLSVSKGSAVNSPILSPPNPFV